MIRIQIESSDTVLASQLIAALAYAKLPQNFEDFEVKNLTQDTREVSENSVFVAIVGQTVDGHNFVDQAVAHGAKLIVASKPLDVDVPVVYVYDTMKALAILASKYFDHPSTKMQMIGVTGTNGKTTVTHMIEAIFRHHKQQTGLIGTMYRRIGTKVFPTKNTTPDVLTVEQTLAQMVEQNVSMATMEVSSIALVQGRVRGIDFDVAVFTNFTQDHLDYHKTMANYAHAKSLLFSQLGNNYADKPKFAVMNVDDKMTKTFANDTAAQILTYGIKNDAMLKADNVDIHERGTDFELTAFGKKYHVHVKTVGLFNVYNLLAAMGAAYASGLSIEEILQALEVFPGVKGRLQLLVDENSGVSAIVDYAHTPDGLKNALSSINDFAKHDVYCVIGCGGDRDANKRPKMAKIAVDNADYVFLTSDNPRTEDPNAILADMQAGIAPGSATVIVDRRQAIQAAIKAAKPGDIVLVAGKGHEDYQIIGTTKHHFDDVEEVKAAFANLK